MREGYFFSQLFLLFVRRAGSLIVNKSCSDISFDLSKIQILMYSVSPLAFCDDFKNPCHSFLALPRNGSSNEIYLLRAGKGVFTKWTT